MSGRDGDLGDRSGDCTFYTAWLISGFRKVLSPLTAKDPYGAHEVDSGWRMVRRTQGKLYEVPNALEVDFE